MTKLDCVLVGGGTLLVQCAKLLTARGHRIQAIVTSDGTAQDWARQEDLAIIEMRDHVYEARLAELQYDWLFSIANLRMLAPAVWRHARVGALNFHDGLLPQMAGLNTPAWAILSGHQTHGVTWHMITDGIDEGDILAQQQIEIGPDEVSLTLNAKCLEAGIATFSTLIADIEAQALSPRAQDFSSRTYHDRFKRPPAAATLDFTASASDIDRMVRGLNFGQGYANPLLAAKVVFDDRVFIVSRLEMLESGRHEPPGLVMSCGPQGAVISTKDAAVLLEAYERQGDRRIALSSVLKAGDYLPLIERATADSLTEIVSEFCRHETFFKSQLSRCVDLSLTNIKPSGEADVLIRELPVRVPENLSGTERLALVGAFLGRLSGQRQFDLAWSSKFIDDLSVRHPGYFSGWLPFRVTMTDDMSVGGLVATVEQTLSGLEDRRGICLDLFDRVPSAMPSALTAGYASSASARSIDGCAITFGLDGERSCVFYDMARIDEIRATSIAKAFEIFAEGFSTATQPLHLLPIMTEAEQEKILHGWNDTDQAYATESCIHSLIEAQVDRTPEATALVFANQSLSYREMDERANAVAKALISAGVGPDVTVGLLIQRSLDLVIGAIAIMKAGGAYVPLDPHFPRDRLAFMVRDSGAKLVLTQKSLSSSPILDGVDFLCIEDVATDASCGRPSIQAGSRNLAYVIYTSGSTGMPKGVMIEHRNVVNFFAGMDGRIPSGEEGGNVWMAVTSLSFDISVLELFWTLAHGFKVVIHASEIHHAKVSGKTGTADLSSLQFGLFFWGNDDGSGRQKYRLLLDSAQFADRNGFESVWTPERHFHAFGGPYPNPAVTGAAVAALTKNLQIRAGSCVLPLHHPARVAEEWSVVDNLSDGRAGIAFASGWMPEDFVLRPENAPPQNKAALIRDIETVRKLWRGDRVEFDFGAGKVSIVTQPRPVQAELPVWMTTAGNPESYREAARLGVNVLTHLLGQSITELAEKINIYRQTLLECGRNPDDYKVTLMLHTFLGTDRDEVREKVRGPMTDYLRSAAALIRQYAWAFPAFKKPAGAEQPTDIDLQTLDASEMDAILKFAFQRYFDDSGLFGTVDDALDRLREVKQAGVDDIACLIDFGLQSDLVMDRLPLLAQVVASTKTSPTTMDPVSFAEEIRKHAVSHLQCTPSMARMFMLMDGDRAALGKIRHLFLGGEALQGSLFRQISAATDATIENMYGPTETTIWSSSHRTEEVSATIPIGRPIANTQFYVLDEQRRPRLTGEVGELYIGGEGVARGYLNRPELTAERFVINPFRTGMMYRTGDLACFDSSGLLHFMGRLDHQVKIRGHRIELGEIEARIASFAGIEEVVVVARQDTQGDPRLVAYIRNKDEPVCEQALRAHVAETLPEIMVPAHVVVMKAFPLTPNAKIDRGRLPPPTQSAPSPASVFTEPANTLQRELCTVFATTLGLDRIGIFDNFFSSGGHSLLAVQLHRQIKATLLPEITITDIYRFPTVALLTDHVTNQGSRADTLLSKASERAAHRRNAVERRQFASGTPLKP